MPYTPPSNRSPASSAPPSPDRSRGPSFHQQPNANSRPVLPRSASYLTRHRRTSPAVAAPRTSELSPEATSEDLKAMVASVRQSPPPITGDRGMPNGAIISPPDSSSDDDDLPQLRGEVRGRQIENLKELHDAVNQIPQRSRLVADAANEVSDAGDLLVLPTQTSCKLHSFSTGSLDSLTGHRRFSHARSATEPHISISKSSSSSGTGSDEDSDGDLLQKPQMVRKKSGELVRPALRPASRRRPSSMPGTPTFSKAVHFDSHLEHVRHFLQVDRPLAVSAGSSPVDNYESDNEYPFSQPARPPLFEWEIVMANVPFDTPARKAQPVRLERVWLSNDQKCLIGSIAVANIAFHKLVVCRFTLDYWKTTSEVAAEYIGEIRPVETPHGQDRFNFTIKLSDLANLESKTLYFCIRYDVNGQEHWDNNGGTNFQVDFRKKLVPRNGKKVIGAASRPLGGLPKSNRRPSLPAKKTAHTDEFGDSQKVNLNQSIYEYLGEESGPTGLRLKGVQSTSDLAGDNLSVGLSAPTGQFSHRYDFGNSLTRAIQSAKDTIGTKSDALYMKPWKRPSAPTALNTTENPHVDTVKTEPTKLASSPVDSSMASISSASYEEIVNKWCFFGSKPKASQPKGNTARGPTDDSPGSSTASYEGSPVLMGNYHHWHSGTQHHSLHPDANPYFQHPVLRAIGTSPVDPPFDARSPQRTVTPPASQPRTPASSSQPPGHSPPLAGNLASLAGTSPNEYPYQRVHDRFPFSGSETYAAAAIRG